MPVIRYRTRDLTRLLPGTARTMRRMEKVTGRTDDMIILRGVNLFPTQIEELVLQLPALSPHFQCVLSRAGTLDELTVLVEHREGVSTASAADAGQPAAAAGEELDRRDRRCRGRRRRTPSSARWARCAGSSTTVRSADAGSWPGHHSTASLPR